MKTKTIIGAWIVLSMSLLSCEETSKPPTVWGTLSALGTLTDTGESGPVTVNGATLGEGDGDLVGFCRYQDGVLNFTVGSDTTGGASLSSDFYFSITGVEGPPSENPYDSDGLPRDDETRGFTGGNIRTGEGEWIFDQEDMLDDRCTVTLFAEASSGDLTPLEYGKERFDYLVVIDCGRGLDSVPSQISPNDSGAVLYGFDVSLWFKNCEE